MKYNVGDKFKVLESDAMLAAHPPKPWPGVPEVTPPISNKIYEILHITNVGTPDGKDRYYLNTREKDRGAWLVLNDAELQEWVNLGWLERSEDEHESE